MICQFMQSTFAKHTESTSSSSHNTHTFVWKNDRFANDERTKKGRHRLPSITECAAREGRLRETLRTCTASPREQLLFSCGCHTVQAASGDELKDLLGLGHTRRKRGDRQVFDATRDRRHVSSELGHHRLRAGPPRCP